MTSPTTAAFDRGAARYDLMVSLNPGYHRELRRAAAQLVAHVDAASGTSLLDLGCGSGASTRALLDAAPDTARILGLDASPGMLAQARAKVWPDRVRFRPGVAGRLDPETIDGQHDGILACYLFRNVPEPQRDEAVREAFALLRPGGVLVAHEYSVADSRMARLVWSLVSWTIILPLGTIIDRNPGLYHYLWRSVRHFDGVTAFTRRLERAGFTDITHTTASGWQRGILHTVVAHKPKES